MVFVADIDMPETELDTTPQSQEAEAALLGVMLYDNEVYHRISHIVQAQHFYNPIHVRIFDAMRKLIMAGKLADAIVLKNRFSQDSTLVDIGGVEYLALLLDNAPPTATGTDYAKLIYDLSTRRELVRLGKDIIEDASNPDSDTDAASQIEDAEVKLFSLAETGQTNRGPVSFSDAIASSIEMAAAAFQRDGTLSGVSTGLVDLDRQLGGLQRSDLIILAGRPSMGKTSLATNIAFNIASKFRETNGETTDGGRVGFFSLEMSNEQLATRLLAQESRVPSTAIRRGDINRAQFDFLTDAASQIEQYPLHIDDKGGISIQELSARARRQKRLCGMDVMVVDYLQLLSCNKSGRNGNRVQEVTNITMGLKALAKELNVPVLALAQLSRQVEQREDKRPQLSDLRESGSIEQDADVVMFAYREEYYHERIKPDELSLEFEEWNTRMAQIAGKAELIIGKQRHGPIGVVPLRFIPHLTKFEDWTE